METLSAIKPRLAFAGVGWIGRARMQAIHESGLAEVAFMTDPSAQCLEDASRIVPQTPIVPSFEELINAADVDGVVIATPSALHMEQAVAAFGRKKAVFCQKPLGRDLEEVTAVVNAAKQHDRLLGADFSYRYTNAFRMIHKLIRSGELGKIFAADLRFHNAYGPDKAWFYDYSLSGGGCVLDLGIHLIDLLLFALDFPGVQKVNGSLFAKGVPLRGRKEVEDYANVSIELDNDVTAQLACSWNLAAGSPAVIEASFYGTRGAVALKNVAGSFYDFEALRYSGTETTRLVSPPDDWGGRALIDWAQKLSYNPGFDPQAMQYLRSAEILDRIYGRN